MEHYFRSSAVKSMKKSMLRINNFIKPLKISQLKRSIFTETRHKSMKLKTDIQNLTRGFWENRKLKKLPISEAAQQNGNKFLL